MAEDGGLARTDAEARAFACCIARWMNCNPPSPQPDPTRCACCGEPMSGPDALPFLAGGGGHVWLHGRCHPDWIKRRRAAAAMALLRLGAHQP